MEKCRYREASVCMLKSLIFNSRTHIPENFCVNNCSIEDDEKKCEMIKKLLNTKEGKLLDIKPDDLPDIKNENSVKIFHDFLRQINGKTELDEDKILTAKDIGYYEHLLFPFIKMIKEATEERFHKDYEKRYQGKDEYDTNITKEKFIKKMFCEAISRFPWDLEFLVGKSQELIGNKLAKEVMVFAAKTGHFSIEDLEYICNRFGI